MVTYPEVRNIDTTTVKTWLLSAGRGRDSEHLYEPESGFWQSNQELLSTKHLLFSQHLPDLRVVWWGEHWPQHLALIRTARHFTTHVLNNWKQPSSCSCLSTICIGFPSPGIAYFPFFLILLSGERLACAGNHTFILVVQVRETCCILLDSHECSKV